jgi:radical SAM protein (TIGR01212 family)
MREILTFGKYLRNKFGESVYKVPIVLSGFTCPNIDGTVARGGCTFCENESFNPSLNKIEKVRGFSLNLKSTINPLLEKQIGELKAQYFAISSHIRKIKKIGKFIVYFQAFTNTYAPINTLETLYLEALKLEGVIGLSIGTRSDSITDEVLELLKKLSEQYEIWIEFGVQSIFDETLQKINRGHDYQNLENAILKSKSYGLNVCGHLIFGLPDESDEMMLATFNRTIELGIDSLKIHPLYVVERTALANQFKRGDFVPISEERYISNLIKALSNLPPNISIQRITAGIENSTLLSPKWCFNKQQSLKKIRQELYKLSIKY